MLTNNNLNDECSSANGVAKSDVLCAPVDRRRYSRQCMVGIATLEVFFFFLSEKSWLPKDAKHRCWRTDCVSSYKYTKKRTTRYRWGGAGWNKPVGKSTVRSGARPFSRYPVNLINWIRKSTSVLVCAGIILPSKRDDSNKNPKQALFPSTPSRGKKNKKGRFFQYFESVVLQNSALLGISAD